MIDPTEHIEYAAVTKLTDLLHRIHPEALAEIVEPSGWTYHTNIGRLVHDAAAEIERLQAQVSVTT